jgi:hypothetical protein
LVVGNCELQLRPGHSWRGVCNIIIESIANGELLTSMAKAEFTLVRKPTAADIILLFESLTGREATAEERRDVEAEMAQRDRR